MTSREIPIITILNNQICQLELISESSIMRCILKWIMLSSTVILFRRRCFNSLRRRRHGASYTTSCSCRVLYWPINAVRRHRFPPIKVQIEFSKNL